MDRLNGPTEWTNEWTNGPKRWTCPRLVRVLNLIRQREPGGHVPKLGAATRHGDEYTEAHGRQFTHTTFHTCKTALTSSVV